MPSDREMAENKLHFYKHVDIFINCESNNTYLMIALFCSFSNSRTLMNMDADSMYSPETKE